uniref:CDAN1-interacting nuclease 1 n=1 Tax=Lynceus sp. MCZ IZ 141354 TaxID=1930659 RepID=A0A9N6ZG35_9CRUS|nr:EOG090X0A0V [Lynceus sp. MCZ IZ 141354]
MDSASVLTSEMYQRIVKDMMLSESVKTNLRILTEKYPQVNSMSLRSIITKQVQKFMKFNHGKLTTPEAIEHYHQRYNNDVQNGKEPGVLLAIAKDVGLPPALLARCILEKHYAPKELSRNQITQYMKDTSLIENIDLSLEVYLCLLDDDVYGTFSEVYNKSIGLEYEVKLQRQLESIGVTYIPEENMRSRGYDKTPDFKLDIPITVDGKVINWIESKALFGDEDTHAGYLRDQLWSYWNRFGSGLVIYWMGHVNNLERLHQGCVILVRSEMPTSIIHMQPNCL